MNRMFPKPGTVFLEFQLFPTRFFANEIVVFTGFFANEKHRFRFLFTFFTSHFPDFDKPDNLEMKVNKGRIITELMKYKTGENEKWKMKKTRNFTDSRENMESALYSPSPLW